MTEPEPGFDAPACIGMAEAEIVTPALVVDLDAMGRNIARMQAFADAQGLRLRPHAKTHRSADVARLQIEAGAVGVCCQTLSEAEALARAGVPDLLVTNQPRGGARAARAARLSKTVRLTVCADDAGGVDELSEAAAAAGARLDVLIEVDVGGGRCGVSSGAPAAALAQRAAEAPSLRFAGLQAYDGGAQHVYAWADRRDRVGAAAARVRDTLAALERRGLSAPQVTGAGTGSYAFEAASGLWTELQCGSYVFMDDDYANVLDEDDAVLSTAFEHALVVLTEVMSTARPGQAVCDAGLKALAMDSGPPRNASAPRHAYKGASDEHGVLDDPSDVLKVGDRMRLIPGHIDPTCNLHDWYVGMRGGRVEALWPVTARGKGF